MSAPWFVSRYFDHIGAPQFYVLSYQYKDSHKYVRATFPWKLKCRLENQLGWRVSRGAFRVPMILLGQRRTTITPDKCSAAKCCAWFNACVNTSAVRYISMKSLEFYISLVNLHVSIIKGHGFDGIHNIILDGPMCHIPNQVTGAWAWLWWRLQSCIRAQQLFQNRSRFLISIFIPEVLWPHHAGTVLRPCIIIILVSCKKPWDHYSFLREAFYFLTDPVPDTVTMNNEQALTMVANNTSRLLSESVNKATHMLFKSFAPAFTDSWFLYSKPI